MLGCLLTCLVAYSTVLTITYVVCWRLSCWICQLATQIYCKAQSKQKFHYNNRPQSSTSAKELWNTCLMRLHGKDRKLALPYHGPYRITDIRTNCLLWRPVDKPDACTTNSCQHGLNVSMSTGGTWSLDYLSITNIINTSILLLLWFPLNLQIITMSPDHVLSTWGCTPNWEWGIVTQTHSCTYVLIIIINISFKYSHVML